MKKNILFKDAYLINDDLQDSLRGNPLRNEGPRLIQNFSGIYIVAFRMLSKEKTNDLVYSYIYYNPLFFVCLLAFFASKGKNSLTFNEHGNYLTIFDLLSLYEDQDYYNYDTVLSYYGTNNLSLAKDKKLPFLYSEALDLIYKLILVCDINIMSNLIDLACKRLYYDFINDILQDFDSFKLFNLNLKKYGDRDIKDHNILKGCIFVVRQIDPLIKSLEDKGYTISQGIQS